MDSILKNNIDNYITKELDFNIMQSQPIKRLQDIKFIESSTLGGMCPVHMDRNGVFYGGTNSGNIVKTTDFISYETINTGIDSATCGVTRKCGITTTRTGRIIVGTVGGYVFVSDENGQNFTQAFKFPKGNWRSCGNYCQHENIIGISEYAVKAVACEAYISLDFGATWTKVFDYTKMLRFSEAEALSTNCHCHGMMYDPYDSRIWLTTGDGSMHNIYYSDDFGQTWVAIADGEKNLQDMSALQMVPYQNGILFYYMADYNAWLPRKANEFRQPVEKYVFYNPQKYNIPHSGQHIKTKLAIQAYPRGCNGIMVREYDFLDTDIIATNSESCMLASRNGINWYEIYRHPVTMPIDYGFQSHPLGPIPNSQDNRIYCYLWDTTGDKIMSAVLPK